MGLRRLARGTLAAVLLMVPACAHADPAPFGHPCTPEAGVLFCPGSSDSDRVPSFDGVPLDVDVTLPATGAPPYPTVAMLHSFGGDKLMLESDTAEGTRSRSGLASAGPASLDHYHNVYLASHGFAVVNASSRGWGRSCGRKDSRSPDCARGWLHDLDQRYEARDVQLLLGMLVDEGIARPDALGVTGISMGGGVAVRLGFLNDRVRLQDGSFAPWLSPAGTPLHIAAIYARWGGGSGLTSLLPNGRPFGSGAAEPGLKPLGILKQSGLDFLVNVASATGFLAPIGADPTADLAGWRATLSRGEPYGAPVQAIARELGDFHSAFTALGSATPPMLLEAGYTDDLTGAIEVLRVYRSLLAAHTGPVALQLGDVGHARGTNPASVVRAMNTGGEQFLETTLLGTGPAPPSGTVSAYPLTCPAAATATPIVAANVDALATRTLHLRGSATQRVTWRGGSPSVAAVVTPRVGGSTTCTTVPADHSRQVASWSWPTKGVTLAGTPTVSTTIRASGAEGQLAFRLWDVDDRGNERLIARAAYRLVRSQHGRIQVPLGIDVYRFGRGHTIRLEILGRDPGYLRPSNAHFNVRVGRVALSLPLR